MLRPVPRLCSALALLVVAIGAQPTAGQDAVPLAENVEASGEHSSPQGTAGTRDGATCLLVGWKAARCSANEAFQCVAGL